MADDLDLGINESYREAILAASKRTGMEPQAIAAVINAEAAKAKKGPDKGKWDPKSKATTSSARGLTQFLDGTWKAEAGRSDTMLGQAAKGKSWAQVSAMRDDPSHSIMAAAEYDSRALKELQDKGLVDQNLTPTQKAQAAYTAHHEGSGGASTLYRYRKGQLSAKELAKYRARTKKMLPAQVGKKEAQRLINEAGGDSAKAYSDWLNGYVGKNIQPDKFRAKPKPAAEAPGTVPAGGSGGAGSGGGGGPKLTDGEKTVLLGTDKREAAHVETPHDGGGKVVEGSQTVFVGKNQYQFARKGDPTNDGYQIKTTTQQNVLIG